MKAQKLTSWILLLSLVAPYVSAANISQKSAGDCSQNVVAKGQVTINCGLSKEEVEKIVAVYAKKHHLSDEQVAALSVAIFALGKGVGKLASKSEINAAITDFQRGNSEKLESLLIDSAFDFEGKPKQKVEKYRAVANALIFLGNYYHASSLFFAITELEPDSIENWKNFADSSELAKNLNGVKLAYQMILELAKAQKNQTEIDMTLEKLDAINLYGLEYKEIIHRKSIENIKKVMEDNDFDFTKWLKKFLRKVAKNI